MLNLFSSAKATLITTKGYKVVYGYLPGRTIKTNLYDIRWLLIWCAFHLRNSTTGWTAKQVFFSKSVKKSVKRAVRVLRARSAQASDARRGCEAYF